MAWIAVKRHHGDIRNLTGEDNAEASALNDLGERALTVKQAENILRFNQEEAQRILNETVENMNLSDLMKEIISWDNLSREIRIEARRIRRDRNPDNYLMTLFLYSVLLDADKIDASNLEPPTRIIGIEENLVDRFRQTTFSIKNDAMSAIRDKAYKETIESLSHIDTSKDRLLSINLPTGIGKTLAVFSFSLKLREKVAKEFGFIPRIIYCLPFLGIIDQNSEVIAKVLQNQFAEIPSNVLLKHHHLSDIKYVEMRNEELYQVEDISKALLLMEAWDSEIVITTFVQFFHSLITNRNRAARKLHNMVNSIIILDEVQAIPSKYWPLIGQLLELLVAKFNCWVVLMTATQPLIFEAGQLKELIPVNESYFKALDRVEYQLDLDEEGRFFSRSLDEFKEIIVKEVKTSYKDIMVVVNTIDSSQKLYEFLKDQLLDEVSDKNQYVDEDGVCNINGTELVNLSTHVLPIARLRRINRIKEDNKRKVIITTQLVEAGVDISADLVYRDLAPLDCIVQTAGRCNRNNEREKGILRIVQLKDDQGRALHRFVYDQSLVDATLQVLGELGIRFSEKDLTPAIKKYYNLARERSRRQESENIADYIRRLDFSEIARFELIEEEGDIVSVFLETGEEAIRTRKRITNLLQVKEGLRRWFELMTLKKSINENTIALRYSNKWESIMNLPTLFGRDFRYVPREQLKRWYRQDIGLTVTEFP
jgi:CRISPR-associated endonuclease/helicase Cas3